MVKVNNLVIIGVSRAGKTTLAAKVGTLVGFDVIDMDQLVLQAWGQDGTVKDCHLSLGNSAFRELEFTVYQSAKFNNPSIISIGGGALLDDACASIIKSWGVLGWLFVNKSEIFARWQANPLVGIKENWENMYINRSRSCAKWADFIIDADPQLAVAQFFNIKRVRYGK